MTRTNGPIVINDSGDPKFVVDQGVPTGDSVAAAIAAVEALAQKATDQAVTDQEADQIRADTATALATAQAAQAQVDAAVTTQDTAVANVLTTEGTASNAAVGVAVSGAVKVAIPTRRSVIAQAQAYVNFATGEASSFGVGQLWSDLVTGATPGAGASVHPAVTNAAAAAPASVIPMVGATIGGQDVPDNTYLKLYAGHSIPVVKAATADTLSLSFPAPSPASTEYCSWCWGAGSGANDFIPAGASILVSVDVTWGNILKPGPGSRPFIYVQPVSGGNSGTNTVYATQQVFPAITADDTGSRVTFRMEMPATGGPFSLRWAWACYDNTQAFDCTLSNIVVTVQSPKQARTYLDGTPQPYTTTSTAASTFTVTVPNGDYAAMVKINDRWLVQQVTVAAGSLASSTLIPAAHGTVTELALFPYASWVPEFFPGLQGTQQQGMDAAAFRNIRFLDTTSSVSSKTQSASRANSPWAWAVGTFQAVAPDRTYCLQSSALIGSTRARVLPGDRNRLDIASGNPNERAELNYQQQWGFGTPVWLSFWARGSAAIVEDGYYAIIHQMQQAPNNAGVTLGPPFSLYLAQTNGQQRIRGIARTDKGVTITVGGGTISNPPAPTDTIVETLFLDKPYVPGEWFRVVAKVTFSNTGVGHVTCWFNGAQVFDADCGAGYNFTASPTYSTGIYRKASSGPLMVDQQHILATTVDQSARATKPHPLCNIDGLDA